MELKLGFESSRKENGRRKEENSDDVLAKSWRFSRLGSFVSCFVLWAFDFVCFCHVLGCGLVSLSCSLCPFTSTVFSLAYSQTRRYCHVLYLICR
jgi:hypothetical protein